MSSTDLPWMHIQGLKNPPSGMLECTVTAIAHKFAPATAEKLLHDYGDCSFVDVIQETQVLTHIEL